VTTDEVELMIAELQRFNADFTHIEAKEAKSELPKHTWQSVSAFSNTPRGGAILFGVAER
jgi:predicted HTH transcriptional regulator